MLRLQIYSVIAYNCIVHCILYIHIYIYLILVYLSRTYLFVSQKPVLKHRYIYISCAKCPRAAYVGEPFNRFRFRLKNHKHSIKHNFSGYPVAMHFNEQSHTIEDLRCIIIKNYVTNMDNRKLIEQKTIIKLNTHITGLNKDKDF